MSVHPLGMMDRPAPLVFGIFYDGMFYFCLGGQAEPLNLLLFLTRRADVSLRLPIPGLWRRL